MRLSQVLRFARSIRPRSIGNPAPPNIGLSNQTTPTTTPTTFQIWKQIAFFGTTSVGLFYVAAEMKNQKLPTLWGEFQVESSEWRRKLNQGEWKEAWKAIGEANQTMVCLIGLNTAIFGFWKIPILKGFMTRHFVHQFQSGRALTLFTATISHQSLTHFLFNMIGLFSFGSQVHMLMGREQFLAFYFSGSIFSTLSSQIFRFAFASRAPLLLRAGSMGASGGVIATLYMFSFYFPDSSVGIIFLPGTSYPTSDAIIMLLSFDTLGLMCQRFFSTNFFRTVLFRVDHAAHLGGALFGYLYSLYGAKLWSERNYYLNELQKRLK